MTIRPYRPEDFPAFRRMLARYYREDVGLPLPEAAEEEFAAQLVSERGDACWLWLALIEGASGVGTFAEPGGARPPSARPEEETGSRPAGFLIAQVDAADSLWNYRPGDGFVRELSVEPAYRRRGVGRALWLCAEARFRQAGTRIVYLTAEEPGCAFWTRMGFAPTGEICRRNRLPLYEKRLFRTWTPGEI